MNKDIKIKKKVQGMEKIYSLEEIKKDSPIYETIEKEGILLYAR